MPTSKKAVDLPTLWINGDSDAPFGHVAAVHVALTRHHEGFESRTIEARAHDAHSFAIRPIELAGLFLAMELLRREGGALWNDRLAITPVDVGALD